MNVLINMKMIATRTRFVPTQMDPTSVAVVEVTKETAGPVQAKIAFNCQVSFLAKILKVLSLLLQLHIKIVLIICFHCSLQILMNVQVLKRMIVT